MKITLCLISEFKDKNLKLTTLEYIKKSSRFAEVELLELYKNKTLLDIKNKFPKSFIVALKEKGKSFPSIEFAKKIESIVSYNSSHIVFCISDADGFWEKDLENADQIWSLSTLTMSHELATTVLSEQIYRAMSILHNHPYHRE